MRTRILVAVIVLFLLGSNQLLAAEDLHGSIELKYLSRFIWRGFDIYRNNHPALQTELDLDLYNTGFGFNMYYTNSTSEGFVDEQWLPFTFYYKNSLFGEDWAQTDYKIGWTYYRFPHEGRRSADMQEMSAEFSWPKIFGNGLTPRYTMAALWPALGDSHVAANGGWAHIFGLDYDWKVNAFDGKIQKITFSSEITYNGSFAPGCATESTYINGKTVDHDWSHAVFGISTEYKFTDNLSLKPTIYLQKSMDKSVNRGDEIWATIGLKYSF